MQKRLRSAALPLLVSAMTLSVASIPARAAWQPNGDSVCTAVFDQFQPQIISDGAGGAIIVWVDGRPGTNYDIYAQRMTASGEIGAGWPINGAPICTAPRTQYAVTLASDGAGGAFIAWDDFRNGLDYDVYIQHITGSGSLASGWPSNGVPLCALSNDQVDPAICSDGNGGALVSWVDYRSGGASSDLYVQRIQADGTVASGWPANGVAVCTATNSQYDLQMISDGSGGTLVAWDDYRAGTSNADIYASRITSAAALAPGWPANGRALCTSTGFQLRPNLCYDGSGGALVTWYDKRNVSTGTDIYATHVASSGAIAAGWTTNGVAVCISSGTQQYPVIAQDGSGGAIIAWEDERNGATNTDIYTLRLSGSGVLASGWLPNGNALCSASGKQTGPVMAADVSGGAIVAWSDLRGGTSNDIYCQRLASNGAAAAGWPANGYLVCSAGGSQQVQVISPDGTGGALLAWQDYRLDASGDIFAQRIGSGAAVDVPGQLLARSALRPAAPNPFSRSTQVTFDLHETRVVDVQVLDVAGRLVRTLASGSFTPGTHSLSWDGNDAAGRATPEGVYLVRAHWAGANHSQKVVRVRR